MMKLVTAVSLLALSACSTDDVFRASAMRLAPQQPFSDVAESMALRQAGALDLSAETPVILVQSTGIHHTRKMFSTVATRGPDGAWSISTIGQETSGLLIMEPRTIPETSRSLTPDQGRTLDRLLGSQALFSQRPKSTGRLGIGSPEHVMEIGTPERRLVVRWTGRLERRAGEIADIILGPAH